MSDVGWFVTGCTITAWVFILFEVYQDWSASQKAKKKEQENLARNVRKMDNKVRDLANCVHNQAWNIGELRRRIEALEGEDNGLD